MNVETTPNIRLHRKKPSYQKLHGAMGVAAPSASLDPPLSTPLVSRYCQLHGERDSVCVCVCVCGWVWVWYGMQQYDVDELLGRRVGPLTCVVSRLHSAGSSVRTADVTADSVLFSLVELTLS